MRGLVVLGTDTGIGKTVVAAGLCAYLRGRGIAVQPLKPIETGVDENGGRPADADLLARCAVTDPDLACVFALREPLAPRLAAERDGVTIALSEIDARVAAIAARGPVLIETAGGVRVELASPGVEMGDLPARYGLPALLVAGNRLGVLSHTMLSVEALSHRGAKLAGVVLNTMHDGAPTLAESLNERELRRLLGAIPLLGPVPFVAAEVRGRRAALGHALAPVGHALLACIV
jgi:dethiobiotin synthetase